MNSKIFFLIISIGYIYFFPLHKSINNPNEFVRAYMTKSMVDYHTFAIGKRIKAKKGRGFKDVDFSVGDWGYVNDRALVCFDKAKTAPNCEGYLYAAKAPGASYLGVPFYAMLKLVKSHPTKIQTIFWLRFFTIIIPAVLFLWLFYTFMLVKTKKKEFSLLALFTLAFGTMYFTYSAMFAGHILAAIFLFSGFIFIDYSFQYQDKRFFYASGAGFFLSLAVISEYPSAIGAMILGIWFLIKTDEKRKAIIAMVAGAFLPALAGAMFHYYAFGSIFKTPYSFLENTKFIKDIAPGFMGLTLPVLHRFWGAFFSPYAGMFFFNPFFAFIIVSILCFVRNRFFYKHQNHFARTRQNKFVDSFRLLPVLAVILGYVLFISSHSLWRGGWEVGPRYILMSVPFFLYFIFSVYDAYESIMPQFFKMLFASLIIVSVFNRVLSYVNSQGYPFEFYNSLYEFSFYLTSRGYVFKNIMNLIGLRGLASALPMFLTILIAGAVLLRYFIKQFAKSKVLAWVSIVFIVFGLAFFEASFSKQPDKRRSDSIKFFIREWQPKDQGSPSRILDKLRHKKKLTSEEIILKNNLASALTKKK